MTDTQDRRIAPFRAVVTGASGFVGFALTGLLADQCGPECVQAIVGPVQHAAEQGRLDRLKDLGVRIVESDLRSKPVLHSGLDEFDVVYHLAAYTRTEDDSRDVRINDLGTARLIAELGPRLSGKRFVYTSTIAAVDTPPGGGRMRIDTPCRPRIEYGKTKLAAETFLKPAAEKTGFDYTILRLPTVYGPGFRPGGMFDVLARELPRNTFAARLHWPGKMAVVEVHDLSHILLEAGTNAALRNRTFFVSTNEDPSMGEIAAGVADSIGVAYHPIALPRWVVSGLGAFRGTFWQSPWLPHWIRISAWRISLVTGGFYCDGSELTSLLQMKYQPWREGFRTMYAARDANSRLAFQ